MPGKGAVSETARCLFNEDQHSENVIGCTNARILHAQIRYAASKNPLESACLRKSVASLHVNRNGYRAIAETVAETLRHNYSGRRPPIGVFLVAPAGDSARFIS